MDFAKTTVRGYKKHLNFGIWCDLYWRFYGSKHLNYLHHLSTCIDKVTLVIPSRVNVRTAGQGDADAESTVNNMRSKHKQ